MATPQTDLAIAVAGMRHRRIHHGTYWQYYDGDQKAKYLSEKLKEMFNGINETLFTQNWCSVVVAAALDRINLDGWTASDNKPANELLEKVWSELAVAIEAHELHEALLVTGEAFLMVWPDEDCDCGLQISFNDARNCHMEYQSFDASEPRFGAKVWRDAYGFHRLELYYPDRFEYYISTASKGVTDDTLPDPGGFVPVSYRAKSIAMREGLDPLDVVDILPNPYGELPLFHFRTGRRSPVGDFKKIMPIQDAINKLLNNLMVSAEAAAFPQRYAITNADMSKLKTGAAVIWEIPPGDVGSQPSQVGQFPAADLKNYTDTLQALVASMGAISRTPKHFFWDANGQPSGEALIAQEAPLVRRVENHIERLSPVWEEVAEFILQLLGVPGDIEGIDATFREYRTILPVTEAGILKTTVDAGVPLVTALRKAGWSQAELDQMAKDKAEADKGSAAALRAAAMGAMAQFDNGDNPGAAPQAALPAPGMQLQQMQGMDGADMQGAGMNTGAA